MWGQVGNIGGHGCRTTCTAEQRRTVISCFQRRRRWCWCYWCKIGKPVQPQREREDGAGSVVFEPVRPAAGRGVDQKLFHARDRVRSPRAKQCVWVNLPGSRASWRPVREELWEYWVWWRQWRSGCRRWRRSRRCWRRLWVFNTRNNVCFGVWYSHGRVGTAPLL